jgi:hypothetical protein
MKVRRTTILQRFTVSATAAAAITAAFAPSALSAQTPSPVQLTPYTAPDQSASAGIPAGWNVTKGGETVIIMTGPQGETIFLGNTMIARNAPFQSGQRPGGGVDLSMPYSANLAQKLIMILQQAAAISGKPAPQVTIITATPLQLPAPLGQCGRFVTSSPGAQGPMKSMVAMCSLPLDSGGIYKNVMFLAQAPAAVAAQDAALASAVFASYRVSTPMLQRKLAPFTQPRVVVGAPGIGAAPMMDDTSAECFDLVVIRETPNYRLPRKCGGQAPND